MFSSATPPSGPLPLVAAFPAPPPPPPPLREIGRDSEFVIEVVELAVVAS